MRRVTILYKTLPSYRLEFFDGLRIALAEHQIDLELVYGDPYGAEASKGDSRALPWANYRPNRFVSMGRRHAIWQPVIDLVRGSDLVVVEQASRLLVNYPLLAAGSMRLGPRVALWGHGANLQVDSASKLSEAAKRRYSKLPHWWFAYTEGSRERVVSLGYPENRVTVVQNAIDTTGLQSAINRVTQSEREDLFRQLGARPGHVGLFMGSLYKDKRLSFLLEAAVRVRQLDPDFVLLVAGDGPDRAVVEQTANAYPFIHYLGRVDGPVRAKLLAASDIMMMPGAVGLAILDAFAAGLPMVALRSPSHGPEIEYLQANRNGLLLEASRVDEYAQAVAGLLQDPMALADMTSHCLEAAELLTVEEMVRRFKCGVVKALAR